MTNRVYVAIAILGVALAACPAWANGGPLARLSDSGIIVPVDEAKAHVVHQKVIITLPEPWWGRKQTPVGAAIVRAEYVLRNLGSTPLPITIGWPTTGDGMRYGELAVRYQPAIKLDGEPVASNFVTFSALVNQLEKPWRARVEKLLESRPKLQERVAAIRKEGQGQGDFWMQTAGRGKLANWMEQNRLGPEDRFKTGVVAVGLLGKSAEYRYSQSGYHVQAALAWLDPTYKPIDAYEVLMKRWGFQVTLLDPGTSELVDLRRLSLDYEPDFGLFRFQIRLEPGKEHHLVVQYKQTLGGMGPWHGLVYLMRPARRWGRWDKTEIEVRVPTSWQVTAIRPPVPKAGVSEGYDVYRTVLDGRPQEDLWVSVATETRDAGGH